MKRGLGWLEERTGLLSAIRWWDASPGGARWERVWGTTLLFLFLVQAVTGAGLLLTYSAGVQTAWESVYQVQYQVPGGWLLRALHVVAAQVFVLLLALVLVQTVLRRLYTAPREANFLLLLALLPLAIAQSVTGWLLPFDQHGLWAARVPLNILGATPLVGGLLRRLLLGGPDVGQATLTRFLAFHVTVLPVLIGGVLAAYLYLTKKHSLAEAAPPAAAGRPGGAYWPDQALRDALACVVVLALALVFVVRPWPGGAATEPGIALGPPAEVAEPFAAARPEWFMLFLFQFLKLFPGGTEVLGAVVIPSLVVGVLALMPWIGRQPKGRRFNAAFVLALVAAAAALTALAKWHDAHDATFQAARSEAARTAARARAMALAPAGLPPTGALSLLQTDPLTQGPRLFARHCAGCHRYAGHDGRGTAPAEPPSASDLAGFGSRIWLSGLLDPKRVAGAHYFGNTKFKDGKMSKFVRREVAEFNPEQTEQLRQVIAAVSAEAGLRRQRDADQRDRALIVRGGELLAGNKVRCTECHQFHKRDEDATAPDLTGYASRAWLLEFLRNSAHERFYGKRNDRMPAFGAEQILDAPALGLLADWLRGEWFEPGP